VRHRLREKIKNSQKNVGRKEGAYRGFEEKESSLGNSSPCRGERNITQTNEREKYRGNTARLDNSRKENVEDQKKRLLNPLPAREKIFYLGERLSGSESKGVGLGKREFQSKPTSEMESRNVGKSGWVERKPQRRDGKSKKILGLQTREKTEIEEIQKKREDQQGKTSCRT